jgi:hypothetical protein
MRGPASSGPWSIKPRQFDCEGEAAAHFNQRSGVRERPVTGAATDSIRPKLAGGNAEIIGDGQRVLSTRFCRSRASGIGQPKTICERCTSGGPSYFATAISVCTASGKPLGNGTSEAA